MYYNEESLKYCLDKTKLKQYNYSQYDERLEFENSLEFKDEVWKEVVYKENNFKVSNMGRICIPSNGKFTFGTICDSGYMNFNSERVHVIVARAFLYNELINLSNITGIDHTQFKVNHKDLNKSNNKTSNLEWTTISENLKHAYKYTAKKTRAIVRTNKDGSDKKEYISIQQGIEDFKKEDIPKTRKAVEICLKKNKDLEKPKYTSNGYVWYYKE